MYKYMRINSFYSKMIETKESPIRLKHDKDFT